LELNQPFVTISPSNAFAASPVLTDADGVPPVVIVTFGGVSSLLF